MDHKPASKLIFSRTDFILLILFLIASNLFTIWFINWEHTIYYWDHSIHWTKYIQITDSFFNDPLKAIKSLLLSIRYNTYNDLPSFLLFPFGLFFGKERLPYILSILNIFVLPTAASFLIIFKKVAAKLYDGYTSIISLMALVTVFTFPPFWTPVLFGYPDVGGIFLINLILLIYLECPFRVQNLQNLILTGLLGAGLLLFRRYVFWEVSFCIAILLSEFLYSLEKRRFNFKNYLNTLINLIIIISVSATAVLAIAHPIIIKMYTTNYSDIYSAFKSNVSALEAFMSPFYYIGVFYFILFLLGLVIGLVSSKTRKFTILLSLQLVIIILIFIRIQDFSSQHYYLLMPAMLLFISLGITAITLKAKTRRAKIILASFFIFILLVNFSKSFIPKISSNIKGVDCLFSRIKHYPLVRNDLGEIGRLSNTLGSLLTGTNDKVYVLSSTPTLNSGILQNAHLSLKNVKNTKDHVFWTHDYDKRDGAPSTLLKAKYIIIASPIQVCNPRTQRVVGIPAESILNHHNIGRSYLKLPYEFMLENNVKVYIYEKIAPLNREDIDSLSGLIQKYYPDRDYVYKIKQ